jgi:tetratricopeptide (TPR) repeat protein
MKNLRLVFLFLFIIAYNSVLAQYDPNKINPKALEAYNKGIEKANEGKYKDAIESMEEAIRRQPNYVDAFLTLGGIYGQMKNHDQSIASYEKAFAIDSNYTSDMRLPMRSILPVRDNSKKRYTRSKHCLREKTLDRPHEKLPNTAAKHFNSQSTLQKHMLLKIMFSLRRT